MGEPLSSEWTTWYKFLPGVIGAVFATVGLMLLSDNMAPIALACLAASLLGILVCWRMQRLTTVSLLGNCLLVRDRKGQHHVPASAVERVVQTHWSSPPLVTVMLRTAQPFGRKIAFIPKGLLLHYLDDGPITERLRNLAESAESGDGTHFT